MNYMTQPLSFIDYKVTVKDLDKTNKLSMADRSTILFSNEILTKF